MIRQDSNLRRTNRNHQHLLRYSVNANWYSTCGIQPREEGNFRLLETISITAVMRGASILWSKVYDPEDYNFGRTRYSWKQSASLR